MRAANLGNRCRRAQLQPGKSYEFPGSGPCICRAVCFCRPVPLRCADCMGQTVCMAGDLICCCPLEGRLGSGGRADPKAWFEVSQQSGLRQGDHRRDPQWEGFPVVPEPPLGRKCSEPPGLYLESRRRVPLVPWPGQVRGSALDQHPSLPWSFQRVRDLLS